MEYFSNMSFNMFGEDKTLDVWLKNDISPVKKKKRKGKNSAGKAREVKPGPPYFINKIAPACVAIKETLNSELKLSFYFSKKQV